jgi:tripartite-type tricarboxylate transporter receptor subunit TctC
VRSFAVRSFTVTKGLITLVLLAITVGAPAQSAESKFPNRPSRYVVAFQAGAASDIVARTVADALTEELGQQVVVDNRSGASGTIGADIAAHAPPDGTRSLPAISPRSR